jgi:hypothetical protein
MRNEELHILYTSPSTESSKVKKNELGRACSTLGEKRNAYRILVGEPE